MNTANRETRRACAQVLDVVRDNARAGKGVQRINRLLANELESSTAELEAFVLRRYDFWRDKGISPLQLPRLAEHDLYRCARQADQEDLPLLAVLAREVLT